MILISIDQSYSGTGFAIFQDGKLIKCGLIRTRNDHSFLERQIFLEDEITKLVEKYLDKDHELRFIAEGNSHGSFGVNVVTHTALIKLLGGIQSRISRLIGVENVFEVSPREWKKNVTGSGKSTKKEVIEAVNKLYGLALKMKDNNTVDAIGIGTYWHGKSE